MSWVTWVLILTGVGLNAAAQLLKRHDVMIDADVVVSVTEIHSR